MSYTVNVRMMVPGENNCNPDYIGHLDLQVNGNIEFQEIVYNNPVFSYDSEADLRVFEQSEANEAYSSCEKRNSNYFKWPFTVTDSGFNAFIQALNDILSKCAQYRISEIHTCKDAGAVSE